MLQIASSQGLLQSLFCSCINPLSALTATETQMTKSSDAVAQSRAALPRSCPERAAQRGSWTMGWRGSRASSKQVLEWGPAEHTGERMKLEPPSPPALLFLVLHGGHLPCVCCTRAQTGARSHFPAPQRMHSRLPGVMPMTLPSGPSHWPCHALPHHWGGWPWGEASRMWTWHSLPGVGKVPHTGHCAHRCVQPGLRLLLCTRTPSAGEKLEHRTGRGARQKGLLLLPRAFRCLFFCLWLPQCPTLLWRGSLGI